MMAARLHNSQVSLAKHIQQDATVMADFHTLSKMNLLNPVRGIGCAEDIEHATHQTAYAQLFQVIDP